MAKTLLLNDDKIRICLDFYDDDDDDRVGQEAQLSPRDRAMRLVSSNLANYHATVRKLLIRQVLTKPMVLSWRFSWRWWRGTVVERRSLAGELSLSCA